jgi:hypothetical protein
MLQPHVVTEWRWKARCCLSVEPPSAASLMGSFLVHVEIVILARSTAGASRQSLHPLPCLCNEQSIRLEQHVRIRPNLSEIQMRRAAQIPF